MKRPAPREPPIRARLRPHLRQARARREGAGPALPLVDSDDRRHRVLSRLGRRQAPAARPAPAVRAAARIRRGREGRSLRGRHRVHPHGDARPRRHHRRGAAAPRADVRQRALGKQPDGALRRLPLHEVDGDRARRGRPDDPEGPVRHDALDDRGGDHRDREDRRRPGHARGGARHHPAQDRRPLLRRLPPAGALRAARRPLRRRAPRRVRPLPRRRVPARSTTSSTTRAAKRRSASPS